MKIKGVFLAAILTAVLCFSGNVFAVLSGGGTQANPYLIQSRADFDEFANPANAAIYWTSGKYTKLMCDPNLSGTTYTQAVIAPDTSTSSGFQGTKFTGIFDGNSHTIINLTINTNGLDKDCLGFFGCISAGAVVANLGLENVSVTGSGNWVYGDFTGGFGALVGDNSGVIQNCWINGSITGGVYSEDVGGLCGWNQSTGSISRCYAIGSVVCGTNSGGIGGLCGSNDGNIINCWSSNSITGKNSLGGLCGFLDGGSITNSYSTGSVSGTAGNLGGLCGERDGGIISNCFWDIQTSGKPTSAGGTGKTTAQMKTLATFTSAGWDFASVWAMPLGQYPVLFLRQMGDLNSDARVDMQDFAIFAGQWLEGI
jgi:hypothetical protein